MRSENSLDWVISGLREPAPRAPSLILTAWGDTVIPFGGQIWLGSLVQLMEPLGLDDRLVRTSVQRLVADSWLETRAYGKRRDVVMAVPRVSETRTVQNKIYSDQCSGWDGKWHLVIANPSSAARRESLRRELTWLGYAGLSPNQYVHPHDRWLLAETRLSAKRLQGEVAYRFEAETKMAESPLTELWPLDQIRADWQGLAESLEVTLEVASRSQHDDRTCFMLRTLAVHAIRRVVLRDPDLPLHLLPDDWPTLRARKAFRSLWQILREPSDRFSCSVLERSDGEVALLEAAYSNRFRTA